MDRNIYLIGFMGGGKTTAGKKLARLCGREFIDLDAMIEGKYRITIPDLFERYDEAAFRKVEHETLKQTFLLQNQVISTGGGTPCFYNNMDLINANGVSIYLKMHPRSLYNRLMNSRKKRPLLDKKSPEEILAFIEDALVRREEYYNRAHYVVRGEDLDLQELLDIIETKVH
jgi:shikimate kinase